MSVPVVLVAGLHGPARAAVAAALLRGRPGALAVHHDLTAIGGGEAVRVVRDAGGVLERTPVRLAHGCVTCTVREDLLPWLRDRADGGAPLLVAELWDCVEPRTVAQALGRAGLRLTAVLTALDAESTPVDLCRSDRLADLGRAAGAGDGRRLAEVLAAQIEYATALVVPPSPHCGEDDVALCAQVLAHLAPLTPLVLPGDALPPVTGRALDVAELDARVEPATARLPGDARNEAATTVAWLSRRPLHPARFFAAMDELAGASVRSRGRFWLASRPDRMIAWDAVAGVASIADAGPWLASLPDAAWDLVPPLRRVAAALDWSAAHGDRIQHLVFTGPDLDGARVHTLLDACLLGPGEDTADLDDPFTPFLDRETA
ncbi:GTP-binding protein [Actinomadura atramentaria]|uniref:GTP-binding protein n=1 Tax=Actinomadura atramentaria TaxID=1990 RepID=UPI0003654DDE|nr:GTP-binding protein [Actinomadura atramentaria]